MRNLAIIPARSGSKGLKDKNIKNLMGKPLMWYSIESAKKSGMFEEIMVSTDSQKYADIAIQAGAKVPFLRSERAANDTSTSWDAVSEVLIQYQRIGKTFDTFMLLQPTSPLRSCNDIIESYNLLEKKEANTIVSVCEVDHSPDQANTLPEDLSLDGFIRSEVKNKRRQDLKKYYRFNGAIYLSRVSSYLETYDIYQGRCYAYIMDRKKSIDIDDEFDFRLVEAIMGMS